MKILLISGHGAGDPGAVSQFGKEADETIYIRPGGFIPDGKKRIQRRKSRKTGG